MRLYGYPVTHAERMWLTQQAGCVRQTVEAWYQGRPVQPRIRVLLEAAAEAAGLALPLAYSSGKVALGDRTPLRRNRGKKVGAPCAPNFGAK